MKYLLQQSKILAALLNAASLSKPQMNMASGAMLKVNNLLAAALAEGNEQVTETIKIYRETK